MNVTAKVTNVVQTETRGTVQFEVPQGKAVIQIAISFPNPLDVAEFQISTMYSIDITPARN